MSDDLKTYDICGVEVFSAGEWNKDKYSVEDLHAMVQSFESLKEGWRPYLKLGHDDGQKLAKSSGMPAIGWVNKLYVRGDKVVADFEAIPEKIYKLIKSKAYRKVSCEVYWDLDVNGTKHPRVIGAVALLGAENPGVMNLKDILAQYATIHKSHEVVFQAFQSQDTFRSYAFNLNGNEPEENLEDLAKAQADLDAQKKLYTSLQSELDKAKTEADEQKKAFDKANEDLKTYRLAAEKSEAEAKAAKVAQFVTELESKKLVSPAMKDMITEILSDKKEYSVAKKAYTKEELITEILTLSKENAKVNFDESSRADYNKEKDSEKALDEEIKKYSAEKNCSYVDAARVVMKEHANKQKK